MTLGLILIGVSAYVMGRTGDAPNPLLGDAIIVATQVCSTGGACGDRVSLDCGWPSLCRVLFPGPFFQLLKAMHLVLEE